jgi:hypothetical protein
MAYVLPHRTSPSALACAVTGLLCAHLRPELVAGVLLMNMGVIPFSAGHRVDWSVPPLIKVRYSGHGRQSTR